MMSFFQPKSRSSATESDNSKTTTTKPLTFERGEQVEVFFRFSCDKGQGYFPVENHAQGMFHPIIVKTDGWFPAIIEQKWEANENDMDVLTRWEKGEDVFGENGNSNSSSNTSDNNAAKDGTTDEVPSSGQTTGKKGKDVIASRDGGNNNGTAAANTASASSSAQEMKNISKDGKRKEQIKNPVKIKFLNTLWFNRVSEQFTESKFRRDQVSFKLVRKRKEVQEPPKLSLFVVRWGGKKKVNAVQEGLGGWGNVGANPSDPFINNLFSQYPLEVLNGPNYEVITAFIQSTHELRDDREGINATTVVSYMDPRSIYRAGLYFLWPIAFQDGHQFSGYVNKSDMIQLMSRMEASGVVSRFPHHSHLYQLLASKEWCSSWCMIPSLKVPLTTKIPRSLCMDKGWKHAALSAIQALNELHHGREMVFSNNMNSTTKSSLTNSDSNPNKFALSKAPKGVAKGVAKLGFSWEALDVRHWDTPEVLAEQLESLIVQKGNKSDYVHVQEYVNIDVEMRCFVVLPKYCGKKVTNNSLKSSTSSFDLPEITKIVYTCYECDDENHFSDFNRFDRDTCVKSRYKNDSKALLDAENQAQSLIGRLLIALRGECSEMPPVLRFDVLARRIGPGKSSIMIGEITELGACFLGWSEGPRVCFKALIKSCLGSDEHGTWNRGYDSSKDLDSMYEDERDHGNANTCRGVERMNRERTNDMIEEEEYERAQSGGGNGYYNDNSSGNNCDSYGNNGYGNSNDNWNGNENENHGEDEGENDNDNGAQSQSDYYGQDFKLPSNYNGDGQTGVTNNDDTTSGAIKESEDSSNTKTVPASDSKKSKSKESNNIDKTLIPFHSQYNKLLDIKRYQQNNNNNISDDSEQNECPQFSVTYYNGQIGYSNAKEPSIASQQRKIAKRMKKTQKKKEKQVLEKEKLMLATPSTQHESEENCNDNSEEDNLNEDDDEDESDNDSGSDDESESGDSQSGESILDEQSRFERDCERWVTETEWKEKRRNQEATDENCVDYSETTINAASDSVDNVDESQVIEQVN